MVALPNESHHDDAVLRRRVWVGRRRWRRERGLWRKGDSEGRGRPNEHADGVRMSFHWNWRPAFCGSSQFHGDLKLRAGEDGRLFQPGLFGDNGYSPITRIDMMGLIRPDCGHFSYCWPNWWVNPNYYTRIWLKSGPTDKELIIFKRILKFLKVKNKS